MYSYTITKFCAACDDVKHPVTAEITDNVRALKTLVQHTGAQTQEEVGKGPCRQRKYLMTTQTSTVTVVSSAYQKETVSGGVPQDEVMKI